MAADKIQETLLQVLKQGLLRPGEQRLFRSGKLEGLFPGRSGAASEAAGIALREGLLEVVRTEIRGKTTIEWVTLTPKALDYVHQHESPLRPLQDLRAALQTTQEGIPQWQAEMRRSLEKLGDRLTEETQQLRQRLQALSASVEEALQRLALLGPHLADDLANSIPWAKEALAYLDRRRAQGIPGECPLPELFAALAPRFQDLSVTSFQEGLRRLNDRRALTLVPWSSSAKEMGQPEFALFDNGNLYYFVALKGVTVPSA